MIWFLTNVKSLDRTSCASWVKRNFMTLLRKTMNSSFDSNYFHTFICNRRTFCDFATLRIIVWNFINIKYISYDIQQNTSRRRYALSFNKAIYKSLLYCVSRFLVHLGDCFKHFLPHRLNNWKVLRILIIISTSLNIFLS